MSSDSHGQSTGVESSGGCPRRLCDRHRVATMSEHARRAMGCTAAVLLLCAGLSDVVPAADSAAQAVMPAWGWSLEPHPVVRAFVAPQTAYSSGHRGIDIAG